MIHSMHMKTSFIPLAITICLLTPGLSAQDAPRKPGAEHKQLAVGVGRWKYTEEAVETPLGKAGKSTYTSDGRMVLAGFFFQESGKGAGPDGPVEWITINAFDPEKGFYGFTFDSQGLSSRPWKGEYLSGKVAGNTWTWTWKQEVKGKTYDCRSVNVFAHDGKTQTYEWTYSEDGTTWKPWVKGTGSKVGSHRS